MSRWGMLFGLGGGLAMSVVHIAVEFEAILKLH